MKRIERGAHDLRVGHDDGEALLALGAEELQVEVHVGLLADTFEKALDDFWFHQFSRGEPAGFAGGAPPWEGLGTL